MQIRDCIHGLITVPPALEYLVQRPEFQRLRELKQLGNVHWRYPGANHTRFEHSLGVMHLAGRVCRKLGANDETTTAVVTAALLHDIGHMAFSHLMDTHLRDKDHGLPAEHEQRSCMLVRHLFDMMPKEMHSRFTGRDISEFVEDVCWIINGMWRPHTVLPVWAFSVVSNSRIDVDRIDYLLRDAHYTCKGGYESDYILANLAIVNDSLYVTPKAEAAVAEMLALRTKMYASVYTHARTQAADAVVLKFLETGACICRVGNLVSPVLHALLRQHRGGAPDSEARLNGWHPSARRDLLNPDPIRSDQIRFDSI